MSASTTHSDANDAEQDHANDAALLLSLHQAPVQARHLVAFQMMGRNDEDTRRTSQGRHYVLPANQNGQVATATSYFPGTLKCVFNQRRLFQSAADEVLKIFSAIARVGPMDGIKNSSILNNKGQLQRATRTFKEGFVALLVYVAVFGIACKLNGRLKDHAGTDTFESHIKPLVTVFISQYPDILNYETILGKNIPNFVAGLKSKAKKHGIWSNARMIELQSDASSLGSRVLDDTLCLGMQYEHFFAATLVIKDLYSSLKPDGLYITNDENSANVLVTILEQKLWHGNL